MEVQVLQGLGARDSAERNMNGCKSGDTSDPDRQCRDLPGRKVLESRTEVLSIFKLLGVAGTHIVGHGHTYSHDMLEDRFVC